MLSLFLAAHARRKFTRISLQLIVHISRSMYERSPSVIKLPASYHREFIVHVGYVHKSGLKPDFLKLKCIGLTRLSLSSV